MRGREEQDVEADRDIATAKVLRLVGGGGPALVGKPVENHAPFLLCTDLDDTLVGDAQSLAVITLYVTHTESHTRTHARTHTHTHMQG